MKNKTTFFSEILKKNLAVPEECDILLESELLIISFSNKTHDFVLEIDSNKEVFCFAVSSQERGDVVLIYPLFFDEESFNYVMPRNH